MGVPLYYSQNPSFHCFLVQIRGIVFLNLTGIDNFKRKQERNELW